MYDYNPAEVREVYFTDRLAVAKNAAENGRLFCALTFVAAMVLHVMSPSVGHDKLAVLALFPIGASVIVDLMPRPIARVIAPFVQFFAAAIWLTLVFQTFKG